MNEYLQSVLLGVIEGLTEFLPVSSTAHLRVAEQLLGIDLKDSYWKTYTVVIQLGAILALVCFFWRRLVALVRTFPRGADGTKTLLTHPLTLVAVATVVTAVPVYLLKKRVGENLENLWVIGSALVIGGFVMGLVDTLFARPTVKRVDDMSLWQAAWVGAVQILAGVFPGTSRSMSTIAAGQVAGLSRPAALEFSFLVSIPIMIAATGHELLEAVRGKGIKPEERVVMDGHHWGVLAVGMAVSFVVAWAVIAWFMAWVRKRGFAPFAIYRIVAGAAVIWLAWRG